LQGQYFDGGIYRSTDAGACWSKLDVDGNDVKNGYWRMLAYGAAKDQFLTFGFNYYDTSQNVGFLKSTDSGASWQTFGNSLQSLLIVGFDLSQDGQVIYASERDSNEIKKSTDGGSGWTTLNKPAGGLIAASPADSQLVLFTGYSSLYRSTDGLTTDQLVLNTHPNAIDDIVFAPSDPTVVYVAARGYHIYKSTDSGANFSLVKNIRDDVLNYDYCPEDADKMEPGTCGCGTADTDTDEDGTADCNDSDSDDDGMPDTWESQYELNPLVDDAASDPDADGVSNYNEYVNGTDPNTADSAEAEVESFVTRFYQLCLNRPPDQSGLDDWVDNLVDGTQSGAEVARGFVFSSEFINQDTSNEEFLAILYSAFFNREPDQGGRAVWLAELDSGKDRGEVLDGFIYAAEFENLCWQYDIMPDQVDAFVARFYELCLDREPDFNGLMAWTHNLRSKVMTGADVARGFIYSSEFINRSTSNQEYLTILYRAFFNRAADQGGWDLWLAELDNGKDREEILNGFIFAQEFIELCEEYEIVPF
jgi:hypothetical protein